MVINGDKVSDMGSGDLPEGEFDRIIDLEGKRVLPGLHDAHIHVMMYGKSLESLDCSAATSIKELQERLRAYSSSRAKGKWIIGQGWEQEVLGAYPSAAELDAVCPEHPVILWRACHHVIVVNSLALQLAGISDSTEDPSGGVIDRDAAGRPTGILRETATLLVSKLARDEPSDRRSHALTGIQRCLEMGLTSVQTNDEEAWELWCQLADEGLLPIRVFLTVYYTEMDNPGQVKAGQRHGSMVSCHRIKLFADGSLGAQTAALSCPYKGMPSHQLCSAHGHGPEHSEHKSEEGEAAATDSKLSQAYGVAIHEQSALNEMVARATAKGYRIELHAIGDRAADMGLTAFEAAQMTPANRPMLTHCQVLRADLLERMARLSCIANVQPQFVTTDSHWAEARLPANLLEYAYAWKTILEKDIPIAGGSDAPIEVPNPFMGMHCAMFRTERTQQAADGKTTVTESKSWRPHECMDFAQALHLYTTGAAFAAGEEHCMGQLKPGFLADFVVVNDDVCAEPQKLKDARPLQVWVDGKRRL